MSNKGYSPAALARRLAQAREAFKRKYYEDPKFRDRERDRHKKRYHENKESEQKRSKKYYEKHREHQLFLARTRTPESTEIHAAIIDLKHGRIDFDEFDRRFSQSLAGLDERIARKSTASRSEDV